MSKNITTPLARAFWGAALATALVAGVAFAAGDHGNHGKGDAGHEKGGHGGAEKHSGGHAHKVSFGKPGDPKRANRTVTVIMKDYEYSIPALTVRNGETVRFVIRNEGEFLHEFNIGTPHMHEEHQEEMIVMFEHGMMTATEINHEMMKMDHSKMGMKPMKHDDPNAVLVEPGKSAELTWTFKKSGRIQFACNIPGHYQSGMVGEITFKR